MVLFGEVVNASVGAFCITEVIPFFTLVADVRVSLLPIGSLLAAFHKLNE